MSELQPNHNSNKHIEPTQIQKDNSVFADTFFSKYPNAFIKGKDSKGRSFLIVKPHGLYRTNDNRVLVRGEDENVGSEVFNLLSENGLATIKNVNGYEMSSVDLKGFDLTGIIDVTSDSKKTDYYIHNPKTQRGMLFHVVTKNISDDLDFLEKIVQAADQKQRQEQ